MVPPRRAYLTSCRVRALPQSAALVQSARWATTMDLSPSLLLSTELASNWSSSQHYDLQGAAMPREGTRRRDGSDLYKQRDREERAARWELKKKRWEERTGRLL